MRQCGRALVASQSYYEWLADMVSEKQDYYGESAKLYANPSLRPNYPQKVFDVIYDFAGPGKDLALDVATGSGQSARVLAERFQQVSTLRTSRFQWCGSCDSDASGARRCWLWT